MDEHGHERATHEQPGDEAAPKERWTRAALTGGSASFVTEGVGGTCGVHGVNLKRFFILLSRIT